MGGRKPLRERVQPIGEGEHGGLELVPAKNRLQGAQGGRLLRLNRQKLAEEVQCFKGDAW